MWSIPRTKRFVFLAFNITVYSQIRQIENGVTYTETENMGKLLAYKRE